MNTSRALAQLGFEPLPPVPISAPPVANNAPKISAAIGTAAPLAPVDFSTPLAQTALPVPLAPVAKCETCPTTTPPSVGNWTSPAHAAPVAMPMASPAGSTQAQPVFSPASPTQPASVPVSTGLVPLQQPALAGPVEATQPYEKPVHNPIPLQPIAAPFHANVVAPPVAMYPVAASVANSTPQLVVKQVLPEQIAPGQPVLADVTVTNTGGRTADFVVITGWWTQGYELTQESVASQQLNGKRAWGMGSIAAGESRMVRLKLTPMSGPLTATEFRSGFDATYSSAVTDTRSIKLLKAELSLSTSAPDLSFVGQTVTMKVNVKNPSAVTMQKVNVIVRLPEHLRHATGKANLETDIAQLAPGATETIPLEFVVMKPGENMVLVHIEAPNCEAIDQKQRVLSIEPKIGVSLHGPKTLFQNWPATFEAIIENQGDTPLKSTSLEVKLPKGMQELRASDKPMFDAASHRLVWTIDSLQPGEKRTIVWFGVVKQTEDLVTTGTISIGSTPIKRAEWTTKNAGPEGK